MSEDDIPDKKPELYLKPVDFFRALLESRRAGEVQDELGKMFLTLATKYTTHFRFVRYPDYLREEFVGAGVLACCGAYDKYAPYSKLGLAIKHGLVQEVQKEEEGGTYRYADPTSLEDVVFSISEYPEHRKMVEKLLENEEIRTGMPLENWDGEELEYDYKTCNNIFAYFTKVIHNAIIGHLKTEYNQKNILNKSKVFAGQDPDHGYLAMYENQEESSGSGIVIDEDDEDSLHA